MAVDDRRRFSAATTRSRIIHGFKLALLAALFGTFLLAEDVVIPIGNYGSISIKSAHFIDVAGDVYLSDLSFVIENNTSSFWAPLTLQFQIGGLCNGEPRQWSFPVDTSVGFSSSGPMTNTVKRFISSESGKVTGCKTEIIRATLVRAVGRTSRVDGMAETQIDLTEELRAIKAKHEADDAANRARETAIAERRRAEDRERAEKDAAEHAQLAATCSRIYKTTADKKVSDLTVREAEQVTICQRLDLYPPR
jgi:hypothetical protein